MNLQIGKSAKKSKTILLVVFAAILFTGLLLVWQSWVGPKQGVEVLREVAEDKTANWKIHRNENFSFEVKCPKEWAIDAEIDDPHLQNFSMSCSKKTAFGILSFRLLINQYAEFGAIPPQYRHEGEGIIVEDISLTPGIYSFDSHHEVFSGFCVDKNFQEISPIFPACEQDSGNFYFQFSLSCKGEEWKEEQGRTKCNHLFNQVLSTFRFLE